MKSKYLQVQTTVVLINCIYKRTTFKSFSFTWVIIKSRRVCSSFPFSHLRTFFLEQWVKFMGMLWHFLYKISIHKSSLRSCSDFKLHSCSARLYPYSGKIILRAHFCTLSISLRCACVKFPCHTWAPYSKVDLITAQ